MLEPSLKKQKTKVLKTRSQECRDRFNPILLNTAMHAIGLVSLASTAMLRSIG